MILKAIITFTLFYLAHSFVWTQTKSYWQEVYKYSSEERVGTSRRILVLREKNLLSAHEFDRPIVFFGNSQNYSYIKECKDHFDTYLKYFSIPRLGISDYIGHYRKALAYKPKAFVVHVSGLNIEKHYSTQDYFLYNRMNLAELADLISSYPSNLSFVSAVNQYSRLLFYQIFQSGRYAFATYTWAHGKLSGDILPHKNQLIASRDKFDYPRDLALKMILKGFDRIRKHAPLVLVQGQLDLLYDQETEEFLRKNLEKYAEKYDNVTYIPKDNLYNFESKDYVDEIHPNFKKGEEYCHSLMPFVFEFLEEHDGERKNEN